MSHANVKPSIFNQLYDDVSMHAYDRQHTSDN